MRLRRLRSGWLRSSFSSSADPAERLGCEEVFWYAYKTWEGDTEARRLHREPWFGLVRPKTEEPKQSMIALKTLSAMRPAGSLVRDGAWRDEKAGVYFPQWTTPDGVNSGALWAKAHRVGEPKREPHVFEFCSSKVEFFDYLGRPSADVSPLGGGKFGVRLSDGVVYFRGGELVKWNLEKANVGREDRRLQADEEGEEVCEMALTVSHRPYHNGLVH